MTHALAVRAKGGSAFAWQRRPVPAVRGRVADVRLQAKSGCSCGGACPACQAGDVHDAEPAGSEATLMREPMEMKEEEMLQAKGADAAAFAAASPPAAQPKLKMGAPDDAFEREADELADQVMRMTDDDVVQTMVADTTGEVRRQPREEEKEEELIQTERADGPARVGPKAAAAVGQLKGGGRPLPGPMRAFFEPRFGMDFSHVRIHDGTAADAASRAVSARAFTLGRDIAFAASEFSPDTARGRHLLAHELTHVIQQRGRTEPAPWVQRVVAGNSICNAGTGGAPADAMDQLRTVDAMATSMAQGASNVLELESFLFTDPTFGGPGAEFEAYAHWFDTPRQAPDGSWRSRFRTATFPTQNEAARHEMETIADRLARVSRWLAGNVRYRCTGNAPFAIPGCAAAACGGAAAQTCTGGSRTVRICPNFWVEPAPQDRSQAAVLIHEAFHPLFQFPNHGTANPAQRGTNPGCYQGFVHQVFGTGILPGDCTRLP